MIKINNNQIIQISFICGGERLKNGECGHYDYNTSFHERQSFNSCEELEKYLNCYGLELSDFKRFDKEEEPTRLNFSREEKEDGLNYYVDYDLYVEVYTLDKKEDYLKNFGEW